MLKIATLDFETDPFEYGCLPKPFVAGFYDGENFSHIWCESDCVGKFVKLLLSLSEKYTIYAHNGGRFDFFYLLSHLSKDLQIINSRIVRANLGQHELRDSFSILPFGLAKYKKDDIDYNWMRPGNRDKHHDEILFYLRNDCVYLHELVTQFIAEFGSKLTVGSAALKQLRKYHTFGCGGQHYDESLRHDFYFGGRNQVFQSGVIDGPLKLYDVNSLYPYVMKSYLHPIDTEVEVYDKIIHRTCFVRVEGENMGAFPQRADNGGLKFDTTKGVFNCSIHEFEAAEETGTFKTYRILRTYNWRNRATFDTYVDRFYNARLKAELEGDKLHKLFFKYVLNSSYGKFAQNPENFFDWLILDCHERPKPWHECSESCKMRMRKHGMPVCHQAWTPAYFADAYVIWQRPIRSLHYYNIATGASITGAARAYLLRGLSHATDPIYCDTDSILCRSLSGVSLSDSQLGAWKLECTCSRAIIAGKKLYALFDEIGKCIKQANKGSKISASEIARIAQGEIVTWKSDVPSFSLDGKHTFIERRIRRTA